MACSPSPKCGLGFKLHTSIMGLMGRTNPSYRLASEMEKLIIYYKINVTKIKSESRSIIQYLMSWNFVLHL
jgi:hypothetical protein